MAFNGSGTFVRDNGVNSGSGLWVLDRDSGANILASRHDTHDQDLANGLSGCITKDGQTTPTADIPMGGYGFTNAAEATARTMLLRASQFQDAGIVWGGTAGGTANALTLTLSPAITEYATGMVVRFIVASNSSAANPTLNINSVGAKTLFRNDGSTGLRAKELRAGTIIEAIYDGTGFRVRPFGAKKETWTPTLGTSGSMTYTSTTITTAEYIVMTGIGLMYVFIEVTGTVGGTPSSSITATLDIAGAEDNVPLACNITDNGSAVAGRCLLGGSNDTLSIRRYDSASWSAGTGAFQATGQIRI